MHVRKKIHLFSFFLLLCSIALPQTPAFSVFLIGDTGELKDSSNVFTLLQQQMKERPASTVIFLGDNIYPNGLITKKNDKHSHEIILFQLRMFRQFTGNVYFIPGNHDWANTRNFERGVERLGNEEKFIEQYMKDSTTIANRNTQSFLPSGGGPGPTLRSLYDGKLKVIFLDTQWFMYLGYKKPTLALQDSVELFYSRLDKMLADAADDSVKVIVTGHHPIFTNGSHSKVRKSPGFLKRWKFQDLSGGIYNQLANKLDSVFIKYPGLIYAAGHDHLLEYFKNNGNHYVVSGAGSKTTMFSKKNVFNPEDPYKVVAQYLEQGFFRVDYFSDGTTKIRLLLATGQEVPLLFSQ